MAEEDLFSPGQPNGGGNANLTELCAVAQRYDSYLLHDYPCDARHFFLCQYNL